MPVFRDAFWKLQVSPYTMEMLLLAVEGSAAAMLVVPSSLCVSGEREKPFSETAATSPSISAESKNAEESAGGVSLLLAAGVSSDASVLAGALSAVWVSGAGAGVFGVCCSLFAGAVCALAWFVGISAEDVSPVPPHPMRLIVHSSMAALAANFVCFILNFHLSFFDRDRLLSSRLS